MNTFVSVLKDCNFPYTDINEIASSTKTKRYLKIILQNKLQICIYQTFLSDVIKVSITFLGKWDIQPIKALANDILLMTIVDSPYIEVQEVKNVNTTLDFMLKVRSEYEIAVLLNICSNFPNNLSIACDVL